MIESYVRTATAINKMSPVEFFSHFGEVARVLRHLDGTADDVATRVYELHKRHASEVCRVLDAAIADHATQIQE